MGRRRHAGRQSPQRCIGADSEANTQPASNANRQTSPSSVLWESMAIAGAAIGEKKCSSEEAGNAAAFLHVCTVQLNTAESRTLPVTLCACVRMQVC